MYRLAVFTNTISRPTEAEQQKVIVKTRQSKPKKKAELKDKREKRLETGSNDKGRRLYVYTITKYGIHIGSAIHPIESLIGHFSSIFTGFRYGMGFLLHYSPQRCPISQDYTMGPYL